MKCPVCESEMQEGGLSANGRFVIWHSKEIFDKKRFLGVLAEGKFLKSKFNFLTMQSKIPNAFYCEKCNKVVGIFDVEE